MNVHNRIQLRINARRLEVWFSDAGSNSMRMLQSVDGLDLSFSRGYVHFTHAQIGADDRAGQSRGVTFNWDNIGFDGPRLPVPRAYDIPDATARSVFEGIDVLNLGYGIRNGKLYTTDDREIAHLMFEDVDLAGATEARLNLGTRGFAKGTVLRYRLNSGPWHDYPYPVGDDRDGLNVSQAESIPVPLAELRQGANTLEFDRTSPHWMVVQNIDLTLYGNFTSLPALESSAPGGGGKGTPVRTTPATDSLSSSMPAPVPSASVGRAGGSNGQGEHHGQ